jgi:hypothetical protein
MVFVSALHFNTEQVLTKVEVQLPSYLWFIPLVRVSEAPIGMKRLGRKGYREMRWIPTNLFVIFITLAFGSMASSLEKIPEKISESPVAFDSHGFQSVRLFKPKKHLGRGVVIFLRPSWRATEI